MPAKRQGFSFDHPIVITLLIFAVIGFMYAAAEVLKPLALAVLLSFALTPVAAFFEHRLRMPRFASVVLTVLLALSVMGVVGYKLGEQLNTLALHLDKDRLKANLERKMGVFLPSKESTLQKLTDVGNDLAKTVASAREVPGAIPVNVVSQPTFREQLQTAVGPYLEYAGVGTFVLILVLFIIANREDLSDRLIRLFGQRRLSLTTKTMEEVGQRISRYLLVFASVNSAMGVIIGVGLWFIGIPLAVLWGVLMALLRFIPYVGPAAAFALPLLFSIATFDGWREPLLIVALFAVVETMANSFLEPVIYGRTTGVTALGLLVAAMFWTWLWGVMGLFLSTPMTVCLAVLGKYVPALHAFSTLLGEDPPLEPDARFYQRLVAMDQEGADQIVQAELKQSPRADVFDGILIPALTRTERDHARGDIDDREQAFIHRFISDLIDELAETPAVALETLTGGPLTSGSPEAAEAVRLLGVTASDRSDELALKMLAVLLEPLGLRMQILTECDTPLKLAEQIAEADPELVVLSYLPPGGFTTARYLVRRLRARLADHPILVGRWGESGDTTKAEEQLRDAGASAVVFRLGDARDQLVKQFVAKPEADPSPGPRPAETPLAASTTSK